MARYTYTAKSSPTKTIRGDIEADSSQDAINKLTKLGYFPVSVQAEDQIGVKLGFWPFARVKNKDIVLFTAQLSTLVGSGVNILKGLNIITEQVTNRYLKSALRDVTGRVQDGLAFSQSLSVHPQVFSPLYVSMVRSGEASGNIEEALRRLSDYMEKEEEFRLTLSQAMVYPAFIFAVSALTIVVLLGFVIPRLVGMFSDMGQVLPLPTKMLITLSDFLRGYWWFGAIIIIAVIFLWQRVRNNPQASLSLDRFKLKAPLLGNIILKAEIGRFMRMLSLLVSGGAPVLAALDVSSSALGNQVLRQEVVKFKNDISSGGMLSGSMRKSKLFPEFTVNIVLVGEETGNLEKAFLRVAQDYEKDVDIALKNIARLIEPVIILVMGLIVCFIVFSMLLPIFQINLVVR
jgi:type II secretory pathway component PulF